MNRSLTLAAWILLSFFAVAQAKAAADSQPQQGEVNAATPTTPAAALFWQAREKARYEHKQRAAAQREQEVSQETGQGSTKSEKAANRKQPKSKGGAK